MEWALNIKSLKGIAKSAAISERAQSFLSSGWAEGIDVTEGEE